VPGIRLLGPSPGERVSNYAYFPILLDGRYPLGRDELNDLLHSNDNRSRRYFYPLISDFPMYRTLPSADRANLPVAADAAERVLCLPIYPDLPLETVERIADLVAQPARLQLQAA
jgi:dTDP-4-amino-4,6-dideoxygalactose transaminase